MFKLGVIALGLFAATATQVQERTDWNKFFGDMSREQRERDAEFDRRVHDMNMENEAFLSRQKANDAEIDQQLTNYYLRNSPRRYGY